MAELPTHTLQWQGSEGCDVAAPGAGVILCLSTHTCSPWLLQGRPGSKAKSLQHRLQAFQAGKSKVLHLRAQLLRCSLKGKKTADGKCIQSPHALQNWHVAQNKPALSKDCSQAFLLVFFHYFVGGGEEGKEKKPGYLSDWYRGAGYTISVAKHSLAFKMPCLGNRGTRAGSGLLFLGKSLKAQQLLLFSGRNRNSPCVNVVLCFRIT